MASVGIIFRPFVSILTETRFNIDRNPEGDLSVVCLVTLVLRGRTSPTSRAGRSWYAIISGSRKFRSYLTWVGRRSVARNTASWKTPPPSWSYSHSMCRYQLYCSHYETPWERSGVHTCLWGLHKCLPLISIQTYPLEQTIGQVLSMFVCIYSVILSGLPCTNWQIPLFEFL